MNHTTCCSGTLPFIPINIVYPREGTHANTQILALFDSASSKCLAKLSFLKKFYPDTQLSKTNSILQLAAPSMIINAPYKTSLTLLFESDNNRVLISLEFLVLNELTHDITLGVPFLLDKNFHLFSKNEVILTTETFSPKSMKKRISKFEPESLIKIPIKYLNTLVESASTVETTPCAGNEGDCEKCPPKGATPDFAQVLSPVFDKYDIDPETQKSMTYEFQKERRVQIPIENMVDSTPLDYLEQKKNYYYNTPQLITLLKFDHLPKSSFEKLKSFIEKHVEIFSKNAYDVAKMRNFEIDIDIDETKLDVSSRPIPIPYKLKGEVKLILDQFLKSGIVEPFEGSRPIISNLICIKKPQLENTRTGVPSYRVVVDLRLPNALFKAQRHHATSVSDILRQLSPEAQHYSSFDLSGSYWALELSKRSRRLFCFREPINGQLLTFTRVPMGFIDSSSFLNKALCKVVKDPLRRPLDAEVYVDDILLTSRKSDPHDHVEDIIELLTRFHIHNLKLNPLKTRFFQKTVNFLGYELEKGTISIPREKIRAFDQTPTPKTRVQLRYFLNATAYFRQNIPNFALYTAPLFELVTQTDPSKTGRKCFEMNELHIKYFNLLKRQIRNSLGIENPNYDRFFLAFVMQIN